MTLLVSKETVFAGSLDVARHQKQINPAAEVRNLPSSNEEFDQACDKLYFFCFFSKCLVYMCSLAHSLSNVSSFPSSEKNANNSLLMSNSIL